jgi:hypothetical protein
MPAVSAKTMARRKGRKETERVAMPQNTLSREKVRKVKKIKAGNS